MAPDQSILDRIGDFFADDMGQEAPVHEAKAKEGIDGDGQPVSEIIDRAVLGDAQVSRMKSRARVKTVDETVTDYGYFDHLRRGKAHGFALGSLFAKRIENIYASWVMGDGVFVALKDGGDELNEADPRVYTDGELADFFRAELTTLIEVERDKFGLGDQYIIVNTDGGLTIPSPDTVTVERNPIDYREVTAVEIVTKLDDATYTDRYEPFFRTVTIKQAGQPDDVFDFENLFGEIPVVIINFGKSANETNGHSVHEQLVPLYDQYDEVVFKQLDGVKLLGNPMLTIAGLEDLTKVVNLNEPATTDQYVDKDGALVDHQQLNIDENAVLLVGKGGTAGYTAPPVGFTADTQQALKTLFLLLLDHTGIPEFIWGNEMSSGRSSSEVQLQQWTKDVTGMRRFDEKWLAKLGKLWLKAASFTDPRIVVDAVAVSWPELLAPDMALLLEKLKFTDLAELLTRQEILELLDIVEDAKKSVEMAEAEADERREVLFPFGDNTGFENQLSQAEQEAADDE